MNRLTNRTYPSRYTADSVSYRYDLLGRRLAATAAGAAGVASATYQYDNVGRLLSTTTDGRTFTHQYDAAGNRTRLTWPDLDAMDSQYDALNRPTASMRLASVPKVTYTYDDLRRRTKASIATAGTGASRALIAAWQARVS